MKNISKRIHAKAPVRVCDIGGWTDTWFAKYGSVFNIAVAPCVEVQIITRPQDNDQRVTLHLNNFDYTYSLDPDNIVYDKHPLIEATIDTMEIPKDIALDIEIFSKIPAGASVGTSAAVCVALIGALDSLTPGQMTPHEIAALAHSVETEKLGLQSGIQDQLCSAYGGINYIHMHAFPHSEVTTLHVPEELQNELGERLVLIYIGTPHHSSNVHKMVISDLGEHAENDHRLDRLRELAADARDAVSTGNLEILGEIMNLNTDAQRSLHPNLVCEKFEELIEIADFFEVSGCKVNGAGGDGGSITILTDGDTEKKDKLLQTLEGNGFQSLPVSLSPQGLLVSGGHF